jgi:transposase
MSDQEIIRRRRFCQFISEISGSSQYLVVGIDVGKETHHAFMGTATGISLFRKLIFENNRDGFRKLSETADQVKRQHGLREIVYGLEPTGNYHKPLARHLIECGIHVVLVAGQAVSNNRQLIDGRWDKHDTKDAANIADLISRGKCLYYDLPSPEIADVRALLSLRRRLKKEEQRLSMRIRNNLIAQHFPELDRFYGACEGEGLAIVRQCLDPKEIAGMEFDDFFQLATKSRRGVAQNLRLSRIYQWATSSIGCPMGHAAEHEARLLAEKLDQVRGQIAENDALMEDICLEFPEYKYLLSIPGFGRYISAVVLAAIADPFRFKNHHQVLKMSGYDLSAIRSGKTSDKATPVISKKGKGELRYALYQAAKVATSKTALFRRYFAKILSGRDREKGIITKMRVKLAAKLLVIAWTLMKNKEVFDPVHIHI